MSWHVAIENAEKMLNSSVIPSSLELISLIKKVNPTTACLSETQREHGYQVKSRLQNLLLEQYGEAFYLAPHPLKSNIVLIKHAVLPSIDACHADLAALSSKALDSVAALDPAPATDDPTNVRKMKTQVAGSGEAPHEALKRAQSCLAEYDFGEAGEVLRSIRMSAREEIESLERAARLLMEEMGAYEQAIELLTAQQSQFLRDPRLRVLLARAYHLTGAVPEARAIFDAMPKADLDKDALVAYADIAHKDGNLVLALKLLKVAEETSGYVGNLERLKKEVETALHAEAEPIAARALSALDCGDTAEAELLARQALQLSPTNKTAREIVVQIDSGRRAAEITSLWDRLAQAEGCEARLELLEKLLLRDRESQERIANLLDVEKTRQKRDSVQARLKRLRALAEEGAWPEAFEVVWWLYDQKDEEEACREACLMSPHLSLLYENRRLRRLSQKSARQLWLDVLKVMTSFQSGETASCLEILETLKHYFEKYEAFREVYHRALQAGQEKAREEIKELLRIAADQNTTLSQAQQCYSAIRKASVHLPAEEAGEFCRIMDERIAELTPPPPEFEAAAVYKWATKYGNHEKAAMYRSMIDNQAIFDECDAEIAAEFSIDRSPVRLEMSKTLKVDLSSAQPLVWVGSTDRHLILREAEDAIVVVHLEKMTAARFQSPNFKDLHISDSIPSDDTFLFMNLEDPAPRWRAELSDEKSAFTACFDIRDFCEHEDDCPVDVYLSSERATDYYAILYDRKEIRPGRVIRKRLGSRSPVSDCVRIGNKLKTVMRRLSWHPDRFLVGAEEEMKVCAKNLTSDYDLSNISMEDIWSIDIENGNIYYLDQAILKRTDFRFKHIERFVDSGCCYFFKEHQKLGLCPATSTLMLGCGPRAGLYDFSCNKVSKPFSWGRIIGTRPARKWYIYDYCKKTLTLKLRDVTEALSTMLEWEEAAIPLYGPQEKEGDSDKLYEQIYFGFKPEEKPEESSAEAPQ